MALQSQTLSTHSPRWWEERRLQTAILWLAGIALLLFFFQWRLKSAYSATYSYYRWSEFVSLPAWVGPVLALRWPARIMAGLAAVALLALEWKAGAVSSALHDTLADKRGALLALGLIGLLSGSYFLLPGHLALSDDAEAYTGYAALARDSMRLGQWPLWTNYGGLGAPVLQFYGPLYLMTVAAAGLIQSDLFEATKTVQLGLHLISVFGMYAFVLRLSGSRAAGLAAAWTYGFTFYRYHAIAFEGILHLSIHLALMPWYFYCLEGILRLPGARGRRAAWAGFSLLGGALLLGHPHYGAFALAFGLLYGLLRQWITPVRWSLVERVRGSGVLLAAWAGSLLVGAYPVLASYLDAKYVSVGGYLDSTGFALGTLEFRQVFTFLGSFWSSEWFGGYIGVSITILALLGLALAIWRRDPSALPLAVGFGLSMYLALGPGHLPFDEIFKRIPLGRLVYMFYTPGRYLFYVTFFGAAAVGLAAGYLTPGNARRGLAALYERLSGASQRIAWPEHVALLLVIIVSADVARFSLQANSLRPPNYWAVRGRTPALNWIQAHVPDPTARILHPESSLFDATVHYFTGRPSFGSIDHEIPPFATRTITVLSDNVKADLRAGAWRPLTQDWLYLTDTAAILTGLPTTGPMKQKAAFSQADFTAIAPLGHSPILAGPALKVVPASADPNDILAGMAIDRERNSAASIPVFSDSALPAVPPTGPLEIHVVSHALAPQHVAITYELSAPAYVQVAYAYYPYLAVRLDGKKIATTTSAFGMIVFHSEAGQHTVDLTPYLAPWRVGLAIVIAVWLALAAHVAFGG